MGQEITIPGTVYLYTFPDWSDLRVAFSAWRVLEAPSTEQILKPSLSKPSTLGTEYRTGLAPTSIPGPYSASNPGLGIGHVDDPPAADATHLLLSPLKSPPAANHSDEHCCPFTGDAHGTLPLTVQGLRPRGVHLLGHFLADLSIGVSTADATSVSPSFRGAPILQKEGSNLRLSSNRYLHPRSLDTLWTNTPTKTSRSTITLLQQVHRAPNHHGRQRGAQAQRRPTQTRILAGNVQELTQTVQVLMEAFRDAHNVQLPQRQPEAAESTPNRLPRSASRRRDPSPTAIRSGRSHQENAGRQQHEEGEPSRMRSRSRRSKVNLSEAPEHPDPTGNNPDDDRREVINVTRNTPLVFDRLGRPDIYRRLGRKASVDKPAERESRDQSRLDYL
ncbi:hypothetical protein TIFTF001_017594 [Ficus carica]|uniref:Uncharacterized protein n=1 Tax=Ficus carica TaxID=3494 RepID=A0AA88ACI8_FICCA|nr:hypothetical protein TIFTF001_017594 [Ficus carica]